MWRNQDISQRNARPRSTFNVGLSKKEEALFMKRTLLTLALVAAAGAAGAQTVTTPPVGRRHCDPAVGGRRRCDHAAGGPAARHHAGRAVAVGRRWWRDGDDAAREQRQPCRPRRLDRPSMTTPGVNPPSASTRACRRASVSAPSHGQPAGSAQRSGLGQRGQEDRARRLQERAGHDPQSGRKWSGKAMRGGAMVDVNGRRARQRHHQVGRSLPSALSEPAPSPDGAGFRRCACGRAASLQSFGARSEGGFVCRTSQPQIPTSPRPSS